ncbi:ribbon-helix-helix domain-containing protein [Glaciecola sp. XM2]|jgi:hypothetical protein|uniref:ribbon-helix-helix domain-containing protein n=1 Tax=Glaciecola sp. XM2 TaxID=1914931 RepID=UPI001BDF5C96|nr:ribbon-helix-helix domain-containing protein [Glaciecola sp. XM2]MBT1450498.1 ribbon-helix-helix domain-containing protein [Glaciecola sp. XM2]
MSLRDLKKSTQSNNTSDAPVDLESFIDGAQTYAFGLDSKREPRANKDSKTKNATFSLTPESLDELMSISKRTGICKSRLLRLLVHDQFYSDDQWLYGQAIK